MAIIRSLWGDEFNIDSSPSQNKKLLNKISHSTEMSTEQILKTKRVSLEEKLRIIKENVYKILGSYKDNTLIITTAEDLSTYIDAAIDNGIISIDTETNNSLDPITCKLMGPCIYTPGMKQAYVPLNHVDPDTGERLPWQLTEKDVAKQFKRLENTQIIMHNGSFDYQVIKCTTGVALHVDWDTMVGARLLNENEPAKLKVQYTTKIDPTIDKYSINTFFEDIEYAIVDPSVFALYAATDAYMTYELFLYQKELFERPENERLYNLFKSVEMPIMTVAAEMELRGVCIDKEYAGRLAAKYREEAGELDVKINQELCKLKPIIDQWRDSTEANEKPLKKNGGTVTVKGIKYGYISGSGGPGDTPYWYEKDTFRQLSGREALRLGLTTDKVLGKSKNDQLADPPVITSPTQLAILMYDVLGLPSVDKDSPRGTGEPVLEKLRDRFPLGEVILQKRGLDKLLNTFVEAIPARVSSKDNRLHAHFNQLGTDTGRFSSSDPNLQNIPSSNKTIRLMFKAQDGYTIVGGDFSLRKAG